MEVTQTTESEKVIINEWCRKLGWDEIDEDFISDCGLFTSHCCCWIYLTNSPVMYVQFFICNPDSKPRDKVLAIKSILNHITNLKESLKKKNVICFCSQPEIGKQLQRNNFKIIENGINSYAMNSIKTNWIQ